jgi:TP901 family phage tail tape measure protein
MANGPNIGYSTLSIIPSTRGMAAALSSQMKGPTAAVGATAGRSMGGAMTSALGTALKVGFGGALVGAGILTGLAKLGGSFDEAFDTIRVGTGATGEALGDLQGSFKSVFGSLPTDMTSASTAIADLNTRLGLTGGNLEATATQFLELSRITGTDLTQNIESVSRVFGDWGITVDDQGDRLDSLFRASQATGIGVDTLSQQMVKYGAPLRQLGFDFDTTAGLLGKFEKEGVNAELVMGSMRIALGKMARDGEPAQETLQRVTDEIATAGSASEANAKALELFGARAGPDMAAAIREGRFELGDLYDTIAFGEETITGAADDTNSWNESWNKLRNQGFVLLEPVASRVFDLLGNGMEWLAEHAPAMGEWFGENIWPGLQTAGDALVTIVEAGLSGLSNWWDTNGETVKGGISAIGDVINDPVIPALEDLWGIVHEDVFPTMKGWVEWIANNKYILVGFGTVVIGGLTVAMTLYAISAWSAVVATLAVVWPFLLAAVLVGALAAAAYYAYENWGWFADGVSLAVGATWSAIRGVKVLVGWLETLSSWLRSGYEWSRKLADSLSNLSGNSLTSSFTSTFGNPFESFFGGWPEFHDGGVMPGPKGQHSLAWVAGGETILPTHKDDFSVVGGGVSEEIRALGDRIASMEVRIGREKVGSVIRSESGDYHRRNG